MSSCRIVVPVVRKGGVGKSTEAILRGDWMNSMGVLWRGWDLDEEQKTFSRHHPQSVTALRPEEARQAQIASIFVSASSRAVTVIDPKAHLHEHILDALTLLAKDEAKNAFKAAGVRVTVLLFPAEDEQRLEDMQDTAERLGDLVDYVLVDNVEMRRESLRLWGDSEMRAWLIKDLGAKEIRIPSLWEHLRLCIAIASDKEGKPLTYLEAAKTPKIDLFHRLFIERWISDVFSEYRRVADLLLSDSFVEQTTTDSCHDNSKPDKRIEKRFRFAGARLDI